MNRNMRGGAVVLSPRDNVATATRDLEAGTSVPLGEMEKRHTVVLKESIRFAHKFSLKPISKGTAIIKYGEVIGLARQDIPEGSHVHLHNVESQRTGQGKAIMQIPRYKGGNKAQKMSCVFLRRIKDYRQQGIRILLGRRVIKIDVKDRKIYLEGKKIS